MHSRVGWIQPEQEGPACVMWTQIWENSTFTKPTVDQPESGYISLCVDGDDDRSTGSTVNPAKRKRREERLRPSLTADRMTPWKKSTPYPDGVVGLHEEILDFYHFMTPLPEERAMREDVVDRISRVIRNRWSQAQVEVFGSFRTGLYLPTSDIDLVVFGKWTSLPLFDLQRAFEEQEVSDDIKVIESARVPIIKLTDKKSRVRVDISFNIPASVESATLIKNFMKKYPVLPKLVLVLKQFLLQRDLNEVFIGGIGSYTLIMLVVSFLQLHPRKDATLHNANVGVLLMEFFELYGKNFNYMNTGIRVSGGGSYFSKNSLGKGHPLANPSFLTIEDPLDASNDISRASWGAMQVKKAFEHALIVLCSVVLPPPDPPALRGDTTFLGRIVRLDEEVIKYRQWVKQNWRLTNHPRPALYSTAVSSPSASARLVSCSPSNVPNDVSTTRPSSLKHQPATTEAQPTANQQTYAAAACGRHAEVSRVGGEVKSAPSSPLIHDSTKSFASENRRSVAGHGQQGVSPGLTRSRSVGLQQQHKVDSSLQRSRTIDGKVKWNAKEASRRSSSQNRQTTLRSTPISDTGSPVRDKNFKARHKKATV